MVNNMEITKEMKEQIEWLLRDFDFTLDAINSDLRYKMSKCNICSSIDNVYYDKYSECLSLNNTKKVKIQNLLSELKGGLK